MNRGWRIGLFLGAAVGLAVLLVWGFAGIPAFGHYRGPYGDLLNAVGVRERHATDVVAAVVLDYRGFDTLGEEFILFASVVGVALLLRAGREEEQIDPSQLARARERPPTTDAVRTLGLALVGPTVLLGLYVVAHGHLTPGGGFQGGAVLASASILVFLCGKYLTFRRLNPVSVLDADEGAGAGGLPAMGLIAILAGSPFLANVLPLGTVGDVFSAGTLPLLNLSIGVGVAAGLVLILSEFLEQTLAIRQR
jgi:multicomponent Na+:H+ antiporter subunit B